MTFSDEYIITLDTVYKLTINKQTDQIKHDEKFIKMFGAWSSIFWALPHFDKFETLEIQDFIKLISSLSYSSAKYLKTTNQSIRTETIEWLIGILKRKIISNSLDDNEVFYFDYWKKEILENPEYDYFYTIEQGENLKKQFEIQKQGLEQKQIIKNENNRMLEVEIQKRQEKRIELIDQHIKQKGFNNNEREKFIESYIAQTAIGKLRIIISENKHLHYYPIEFASYSTDTLRLLEKDERTNLLSKITKSKIPQWNETKRNLIKILIENTENE